MESCISHVSLGANDMSAMLAFYDAALAPLGVRRVMEAGEHGVAYGRAFPEFWVGPPLDGARATPGNGIHVAFLANDRAAVEAFHAEGLRAGGSCDGPPGPRPHYAPQYYGAFLRDPEGNKVEAMLLEGVDP